MRVLGLDPSLTNFGWAVVDTDHPVGDPKRVVARGRFKTSSKMIFIKRNVYMRESLRQLIQEHGVQRVGVEYPIFDAIYSEGMYGLFLFTCEALMDCKCDVVFWTALQAKSFARDFIDRAPGWPMDKQDMVEAAQATGGGGRWNHNEADAFHVGCLAARFWLYYDEEITDADLSPTEKRYFNKVHTYVRGKKAGKTVRSGMLYREDDRFFLWSQLEDQESKED